MDANHVKERYALISWALDERLRRLLAASEAKVLGRGGITEVSKATGISRRAIHAGLKEIELRDQQDPTLYKIRRPGGGRKKAVENDPTLIKDLESLIEPFGVTNSEPPLRWTTKGLRHLSKELSHMGHPLSHNAVGALLKDLGYKLQTNTTHDEFSNHVERNAQFANIFTKITTRASDDSPTIFLETYGMVSESGHDYRDPAHLTGNGDLDMGNYQLLQRFAIHAIRDWWQHHGSKSFPNASDLLVIANGGGSNGPRTRFWKLELQRLANYIDLPIQFCHFPTGTIKWNSKTNQISTGLNINNDDGLEANYQVELKILGNLRNNPQRISNSLDGSIASNVIDVPYEKFATINIVREAFQRDWNYAILPNNSSPIVFFHDH